MAYTGCNEKQMNNQFIHTEIQGPVARLKLNRPASRNAIHGAMIEEIVSFLQSIRTDPFVRVLVVEGEGPAFCAGADLNWMQAAGTMDAASNTDDALAFARCLYLLYSLPIITVARVHGAAYGGGIGFMAACDLAVISSDCSLAFSEVRLGLLPATIAPYVLQKAHTGIDAYLLTGSRFDGNTAVFLGLATAAVDEPQLDARLHALVEDLLQAAPEAQLRARELIRTIRKHQPDENMVSSTASLLADIRASAEAREGISAFLENRQPTYVTNYNLISHAR